MRRKSAFVPTAVTLLAALFAACDLSPTELDGLDPAQMNSVLQAAATRDPNPGRRALYTLARSGVGEQAALPQLDSLFGLALAAQAATDPARSDRDRALQRRLRDDAWSDIARGEIVRGEDRLRTVRRFQAETVVRVFGAPTAVLYATWLDRSIRQATQKLESTPPNEETARLEQMVGTVRELQVDARRAMAAGDPAGSVDLATHAAGLANTLIRRLSER